MLKPEVKRDVSFMLFCILFVVLMGREYVHAHPVIRPIPEVYAVEPTPEKKPDPTPENIIAYIAEVFKPEGTAVVVKAINCFYSESGLRTDAYNWNPSSNSEDIGVAQVNLKYHPDVSKESMYDFQKNIDKAYRIYKSRKGFGAWYGKGCK